MEKKCVKEVKEVIANIVANGGFGGYYFSIL